MGHAGTIILDGMAYQLVSTTATHVAACIPTDFLGMTTDKLFELLQYILLVIDKLKAEYKCSPSNLVLKYIKQKLDRPNRYRDEAG